MKACEVHRGDIIEFAGREAAVTDVSKTPANLLKIEFGTTADLRGCVEVPWDEDVPVRPYTPAVVFSEMIRELQPFLTVPAAIPNLEAALQKAYTAGALDERRKKAE